MNLVHDFRHDKDIRAPDEPFVYSDERIDAILASTAEYLCDEVGHEPPAWLEQVPPPKDPWFVAEDDSLMARAIVESPLRFRIRKIFVLENFLRGV